MAVPAGSPARSSGVRVTTRSPERPRSTATARASRTVRLDLEFDGAGFAGWQRQADTRTVQGEIEVALERLTGSPTAVAGAGRTDSGVHAHGMVASFSTPSRLSAAELLRALDAILPDDIGVLRVRDVATDFHAIRDARWKWYRYTLFPSRRRRVHVRRFAWRVVTPLDVPTLRAGLDVVRGTHDFRRFQKAGSPRVVTRRTMLGIDVALERDLIHVDIVGDGFLYGMVRLLVGTLVSCARHVGGVRAVERMRALLDGPSGAHHVGSSAPAHGLSLMAVGFEGDEPPPFVGDAPLADLESRLGSG